MLKGNAARKYHEESHLHFGIREEPEAVVLDLWERLERSRRDPFTSYTYEEMIMTMREAYEESRQSKQMTYILGDCLLELGKEEEGILLLKDAASRGFGPAQLRLGHQHASSGNDYKQAAKHYKTASDLNVVEASFNLARMCADGEGVDKDDDRAEELYRKAINEGTYESYNNLAILLFNKDNTDPNALELWEQGVDADATVCFMAVVGIISNNHLGLPLSSMDKKTLKRAQALVKIAHARHDDRADEFMMRMGLSPLRITGQQVTDEDPMSIDACAACLSRLTDLHTCSQCKSVYYCSRDCQQVDWRARHFRLCTSACET